MVFDLCCFSMGGGGDFIRSLNKSPADFGDDNDVGWTL